jgi:TRAP-type C4-dicarboxylate transport system permease large subunit
MRYRRLLLILLVSVAFLQVGCFARILAPPLLIPVPIIAPAGGGWGDHPGYYRNHDDRWR